MATNDWNNFVKEETVRQLRSMIYTKESMNVHKKTPKKDSEMVDELIKLIKRTVNEEEMNNAD